MTRCQTAPQHQITPPLIRLSRITSLVEPLLQRAGHQFLDVDGLAEQVIIARDEYPANLS